MHLSFRGLAMIKNLQRLGESAGLARKKKLAVITKSVPSAHAAAASIDGWEVLSKSKKSTRFSKRKEPLMALEDRVWMLLYRLAFSSISGAGGSSLSVKRKAGDETTIQLGILGVNDEVSVVVRCIASTLKRGLIEQLVEDIQSNRETIIRAIANTVPAENKRQTVFVLIASDIKLSTTQRAALEAAHITVFDQLDLDYYEKLTSHLGPAAKYQLLADVLPGRTIPALAIRVPAVKTKIGGVACYTFAISPEYLLKIAYVSHRSKGKASDVDTYQRMVSKSRLATIKQYISDDGVFPTNIVLNIDKDRLIFERVKQANAKDDQTDSGTLGWLDIKPAYKSAWIIDGQHRLYAYSGHERAHNSHLSVLAFEGLSASKQAQLFIDINAKQKSVKQSLLQELYAELHWDADEPAIRVRAIVSKAIQVIDEDAGSPFKGKIQTADSTRDNNRCVSITSIFGSLEKPGFFIAKERKGAVIEFGALWAGDNKSTLSRTVGVLNAWFGPIAERASDWWTLGAAEGGGLSMNDGIVTCIEVLRSVLSTLEQEQNSLLKLSDASLTNLLLPYSNALATYLAGLSVSARKQFRDFRGVQGVTTRVRRCQQAIREQISQFNPSGLDEFIQAEKQQTNARAKTVIDNIEVMLQRLVIEVLKAEFEDEYWLLGVPQSVRTTASDRYEKDDGKRGLRECYLDLIDYRKIAVDQWTLFEGLLGYGKNGNKDKRTHWLVVVNDSRKVVAHASSGKTLTLEELEALHGYELWLVDSIANDQVNEAPALQGGETV
jgi:DNA sulfur modification protein DndB